MKSSWRWSLIAVLLLIGFAAMHYFAPLQAGSVIFDLALLAMVAGALSILIPLRFLDVRSRKVGVLVFLVGLIVGGAALNWPAPVMQATGPKSAIDEFMPEYNFREFHTTMVHAAPDRVYDAVKQTTFADVKLFATLMQLRVAASGRFHRVDAPKVSILEVMARPGSGFVPLAERDRREIVMGLAGKFWSNERPPRISSAEEFVAFHQAGSVKSVFNIRIEDAAGGWSRVSTETRTIGNDEEGRRKMAAYWRVIYPGSATIRRMWLNGIKARAERT